jgi:hypothetical protein
MTDSFPEQLSRLRMKPTCEAQEVGELIIAAGSMEELLLILINDSRPEDRPIVTQLIRYLTMEHGQHEGLSVCLIGCSYLLANNGNVEDCLLIWEAKMANSSAFMGLWDVLLVGAGVEETMSYLRQKSARQWSFRSLFRPWTPAEKTGRETKEAMRHIKKALKAGRFENREAQIEGVKRFCIRNMVQTV